MRRYPLAFALLFATVTLAARAPLTHAQNAAPAPGPLAQNAALQYWLAFALLPQPNTPLANAVANWDHTPLGPELDDLPNLPALRHLHRGAALTACDWGLRPEVDGPMTMLPHLGKSRELARLGLLRARWHFENGRPAAALDDVRAVLALSRHAAADGLLIGYLVQVAIEGQTLEFLGREFRRLSPDDVAALAKLWANLSAGVSLKQALASEPRLAEPWLTALTKETDPAKRVAKLREMGTELPADLTALMQDDKQLAAALGEYRAMFRELLQVCDLPLSAQTAAADALQKRVEKSPNAMVKLGLPALGQVHLTGVKVEVYRTMLKAALAYRQGGAAAVKQIQDPATDQPFTLQESADSFTLESSYQYKNKPVKLEFSK